MAYGIGDNNIINGFHATNKATVVSLKDQYGYYEIRETATPAGYVILNGGKFFIKVADGTVTLLTPDTSKVVTEWQTWTTTANADKLELNTTTNTLTIGNEPGTAFPNTGGSGTMPFYLVGALLLFVAGIVLARRTRHSR